MKPMYKYVFLGITLLTASIYAEIPHKQWKEPFSQESHEEVQGWINELLMKFSRAYDKHDYPEMRRISEQIQNLIHLEFESNREGTK